MIENEIKKIVLNSLKLDESEYDEELAAGDIPTWDSLGHLNLLMAIEDRFSISFDIADSIDIETIEDLIEVTKKYVVQSGGRV